jgi:phenylalanyl-tRNA synthetase beta chain
MVLNFLKQLFATKQRTFDNIIVAQVIKVEKHPNADRLRIIELSDGTSTIGPIVCGAWNFEAGAKVALALPGAKIPYNDTVLTKATIRGIESQGMICAAFELGIGPKSDQPEIMILKDDARLGSNFSPDLVK